MVESARGLPRLLRELFLLQVRLAQMKWFGINAPVPENRALSFIDDRMAILSPNHFLNVAAIATVTESLHKHSGVKDISLNRRKLQALLANWVEPEHFTEQHRRVMEVKGLMVVMG